MMWENDSDITLNEKETGYKMVQYDTNCGGGGKA